MARKKGKKELEVFFWLNLASWIRSFSKMAKKMFFIKLGFLVAKFLQLFKKYIARFLYWVPASSQNFEGILNFFYFHILFIANFS
jgi:hypothetical protein